MGGKSKSKQESTTTTSGWKPVLDQFEQNVLPNVSQWTQDFGQGQGLWSDSYLAPEDPNVTKGQNQLLRGANNYENAFGNVNKTLQGFLNYDPNSPQNQAARDALGANISSLFQESIQPGIEDLGTMSGQFGGNQQNLALGAATAPLSRAIADSEVSLMNADRDRAFNAMLNANGILAGNFVPGQVTEGVGNARTARDQLELQDIMQQFEAPRNNRYRSLAETSGLLYPLANLSQTSNSVATSKSGGNPWQAALGLGSIAADMYTGGGFGSLAGLFGGGSEGGGFNTNVGSQAGGSLITDLNW